MRITESLGVDVEWAMFYRNSNNDVSICRDFVSRFVKPLASRIQITATDKNPRRIGWHKIQHLGGYNLGSLLIDGREAPTVCIHNRLANFVNNAFKFTPMQPFTLWIKIEVV